MHCTGTLRHVPLFEWQKAPKATIMQQQSKVKTTAFTFFIIHLALNCMDQGY